MPIYGHECETNSGRSVIFVKLSFISLILCKNIVQVAAILSRKSNSDLNNSDWPTLRCNILKEVEEQAQSDRKFQVWKRKKKCVKSLLSSSIQP